MAGRPKRRELRRLAGLPALPKQPQLDPEELARRRDAAAIRGMLPVAPDAISKPLPAGWNQMSPAQKLQILYGESLEVCYMALAYRGTDPSQITERTKVTAHVLMIAQKLAIEDHRGLERRRAVEELMKNLDAGADRTFREHAAETVSHVPVDGTKHGD